MPISLMPLPYPEDALAPEISAETLQFHHGKHHKAYVDKANAATKGTDLESATVEELIAAARAKNDKKLFNNAGQVWNHGFYWKSLSPSKTQPAGELAQAIDRDFGSLDKLIEELAAQGADHFASGWVWLAAKDGKLSVEQTHDAETLADGAANPLLVVDVWEHAYYIDRRNDRAAYLKVVLNQVLNWDFAAERYAAGKAWTYPAEKVSEQA